MQLAVLREAVNMGGTVLLLRLGLLCNNVFFSTERIPRLALTVTRKSQAFCDFAFVVKIGIRSCWFLIHSQKCAAVHQDEVSGYQ
jgi:hypothetical protein